MTAGMEAILRAIEPDELDAFWADEQQEAADRQEALRAFALNFLRNSIARLMPPPGPQWPYQ